MGSQGPGRKRTTSKNGLTAEEDALNVIAREAEARLTAKRAARVEAREIRMKELERQQKEKYYGLDNLDNKWGDIEQWMEDSEHYTLLSRRRALVSDDEERMSVGSRSSVRGDCSSSVASKMRSTASISGLSKNPDHVTISDLPDVNRGLSMADDRFERDYLEKGSHTSLGGTSSQRGSGDIFISADTETSIREIKEIHELKDQIQVVDAKHMQNIKEIKDSRLEAEQKYRKAMVSNAQLDNEKTNLIYEVDTLKDSLIELEEMLYETRRELEEKTKDLEREKHAHSILQFQFNELKETLQQSEELLTEIRQLRLEQDGFVREISDLQETIEWKNKKIGALERQKEFSDAVGNERDELRDEVIQLKDILKKHGIFLGPDLTTNGETGEEVGEGDQGSGTSSAEIREGSSVLGTHPLKLCKDQHQKDWDEEVQENQESSQVPLSSTKASLETNENGDLRDGVNMDSKESGPEEPQSSVGEDVLTETRTMDEIKAEQLVLEDSGNNTVESVCDVHTDGPMKKDQQVTVICAKHSQIEQETTLESVSVTTLDEEPKLDNKSKPVEEPVKSVQTEKRPQTQGASASNKKRKKRRKSKQKQKQSDKQESETKIDDKNEKGPSEDNRCPKMESDSERNQEEHLENDVSTAMNTDVPDDNKRNPKLDCVEINTNINADDAREKFQVIPDVVDSAEHSNPISNIVPSEVCVSKLTEVNDDQTEDSTNPAKEISSEEALLYNECSDKPTGAVDRCVGTLEAINSSDNIENSLFVDSKKVTSDEYLDTVGEEARLQNIKPEKTMVPCYHDESTPKCLSESAHPFTSVIEKVEDEGEKVIQEQPLVLINQEVERHLQNCIEEYQEEDRTQQDKLQGAVMPSEEVVHGDNNVGIAESQIQLNLEKGEGDEEERSLHGQVLPENHHTGNYEVNQESLELQVSHHESKLDKDEDGKEGSFQGQALLDTQLPRKDEDILVEKEDEDEENARTSQNQDILDRQLPGEDEKILVEKCEEDEKERSFQDQDMLDTELPQEYKDIHVEKGEECEKEGSFQDQVMPDTQLPHEDEKILVEKGEEGEKEGSFQHQVVLDKLPQEDESILVESVPLELKEDEEEDGESFDFDDMALETSSDAPLKNCQDQLDEEVTLKENVQEAACKDYQSNIIEDQIQEDGEPLELADKETEPKKQMNDGHCIENPQTTTEVEACLREDSQINKIDSKPNQQQDDTPQPKECTFEKHQQASEEPRHNEEADLIIETEIRDAVQEFSSSIAYEDQVSMISGEQEVERETARNNKEDDEKESKKSSKKGKGKGKEECKMS